MAERVGPPELQTQKGKISELINNPLVKGHTWFLIDNKWFTQWKKYVGFDSWDDYNMGNSAFNPGPIDNSGLIKDGTENHLMEHLINDLDYVLVPQEAWDKLIEWYGVVESQEPIARKVIEYGMFVKHRKVEIYLMELKLCENGRPDTYITHQFSRADTIETIENKMRMLFNISDDTETTVWNKYMSNTYEHLSRKENTVQDAGLYQGQVLVIEQKNEDGSWPRQSSVSSTSSSSSSSSSTSTYNGSNSRNICKKEQPIQKIYYTPAMMKNCGRISHECAVLGQIGEQFNNPDMSDVTLKVGDQSYYGHRFVLAAQSSVFKSMLMYNRWKESCEKVIQLEESQEGEEAFCDFLKYFYTGKLTFSGDNVCGVHMLADKYDMPLVKGETEKFMQEVLSGVHGEALPSSLKWLSYIEQFIPDLLPKCYEALQTNFTGLTVTWPKELENVCIDNLAPRHLKEILTCPSSEKDLALLSEMDIYIFLEDWAKSKFKQLSSEEAKSELETILPLIRFHNMNGEELQKVEDSDLCKAIGKSFVSDYICPAYKVRYQRLSMVVACQSQKSGAGDIKCPYMSADVCPHLNPRFYFQPTSSPFVLSVDINASSQKKLKPLDLGTMETCVKAYTGDKAGKGSWSVSWRGNYQAAGDHINETFTVKPVAADIGRKFTVAVLLLGPRKDPKFRYAIKHTDDVKMARGQKQAEPFVFNSPLRPKTSWNINVKDDSFLLSVSIHLHKP